MLKRYRAYQEARKWGKAISFDSFLKCRTNEDMENFFFTFDRISLMLEDIKYDNIDTSRYGLLPQYIDYILKKGRETLDKVPKPIKPNPQLNKDKVKFGTAAALWYNLNDGDEVEISTDGPGRIRKVVVIDKTTRNKSITDRLEMEMYAPDLARIHGYRAKYKDCKKEIISPYESFYAEYKLRVIKSTSPKHGPEKVKNT